jgi:hypothetical protein
MRLGAEASSLRQRVFRTPLEETGASFSGSPFFTLLPYCPSINRLNWGWRALDEFVCGQKLSKNPQARKTARFGIFALHNIVHFLIFLKSIRLHQFH